MRSEQEQRDLGGIETRYLGNSREWRRLIGRGAVLRSRNNMASRTPSVSKPFAIVSVGSKCRDGRKGRSEYQTATDIKWYSRSNQFE